MSQINTGFILPISQLFAAFAPLAVKKPAVPLSSAPYAASCKNAPRTLIIYHERLGDVARCLPLALHFASQGHEVFFECRIEYHALFTLVDYAIPIAPGEVPHDQFDTVHDLQIWPRRFKQFESSGLNWMDFIYGDFPRVPREILFNRSPSIRVPEWVRQSALVFPNGYSQRNAPDPRKVILQAHALFPLTPIVALGVPALGLPSLPSIPHLVAWIAAARYVLTVNTAPSILASAVRQTWHHIPDQDPRHDWQHERAIRVEREG